MRDVMLDLETLGTSSSAAILQIGAVFFDPRSDELAAGGFEVTVDLQSCLDAGLQVDGATVYWWLKQSDVARAAVTQPSMRLPPALLALGQYLSREPEVRLWSHGAAFDVPILEGAYRACGLKVPWDHRAARDTRTFFWAAEDLTGWWTKPVREVAHTALADAIAQARDVQAAYAALRGRLGG